MIGTICWDNFNLPHIFLEYCNIQFYTSLGNVHNTLYYIKEGFALYAK
jgi:hypothetical protein